MPARLDAATKSAALSQIVGSHVASKNEKEKLRLPSLLRRKIQSRIIISFRTNSRNTFEIDRIDAMRPIARVPSSARPLYERNILFTYFVEK